jgi:cysteinyl-tRNA synthetase
MHNGFLQVEGEKMSKSLGNFFTVRDLLERGIPGEVIRFVLLSTHYRQPMDWTKRKVEDARATLRKWSELTDDTEPEEPLDDALAALSDDLNTPGAIAAMHEAARAGDRHRLFATMALMGIKRTEVRRREVLTRDQSARIDALMAARREARLRKDYAKSDAIRGLMEMAGVVVEDGKQPEWRVGFDNAVFGWLRVSRPVADRKVRLTRDELKQLAAERGIDFTEDAKGHWTQAGFSGEPQTIDAKLIELAEREALE